MKGFASDNFAGVLPEVMTALATANTGHAPAYGADDWTRRAEEIFCRHFGADSKVFFAFNGTAANVLSLQSLTRPHHAVFCSEAAHIAVDECGAPERFTGCKLVPVPHHDGKIRVEDIEARLSGVGDQHHVQPRVVSVSQTTELGTVYTPGQVRALADFCHRHGMRLHMDGARIGNAAASLGLPFSAFTREAGVDVLSFGGTKAGLLGAEAVVFFDSAAAEDFKFVRKQAMQLPSKMRFIATQFIALLEGDLWLKSCSHSNRMAALLAAELHGIPQVRLETPVEANSLFPVLPRELVRRLQAEFSFYTWKSGAREDQVRWMMSWDTTEDEVRAFARRIRELVS